MGEDTTCRKCGYFAGRPNTLDNKGDYILFTCRSCEIGYYNAEEITELKKEGLK